MRSSYRKWIKEKEFYKNLLNNKKAHLIFDVGANVGHKSYIFSGLAKKVIAFEPSPVCTHILKSRFSGSNVFINKIALGKETGELDFYEITENEAYNTLSKKHIDTTVQERGVADAQKIKSMKITVKPVEEYIQSIGLPDYLKIDVEGYEIEVLKGLKSLVPLISFEANLPEFRNEAIEGILYLDKLSGQKYVYKLTEDTEYIFESETTAEEVISFINNTSLRYLEIYAILK